MISGRQMVREYRTQILRQNLASRRPESPLVNLQAASITPPEDQRNLQQNMLKKPERGNFMSRNYMPGHYVNFLA